MEFTELALISRSNSIYKIINPKAKISISKYYSDIEDKFLNDEHLPISALSGGLKLVSFF
ncbi:hypothetical protein FACS1894155_11470 [Bacteroidia bacterium]|nr:hypothetical protein FACS1894155_11470 [Bacteroidia bacterium]